MSPGNDLAAWFLQGPDFWKKTKDFLESIEEDAIYPDGADFSHHNLITDYKDNEDYEETVHDKLPYKRIQVEDIHFAEKGKYRAVLKLRNYFVEWNQDKTRCEVQCRIGTGWLIDDTEVATAGHCAYSKHFGHLISTQIYLGFKDNEWMDMRYGRRVVVPYRFLESELPGDDLAVIHFDTPFERVTPIKWVPTPEEGKVNLTVVGYPKDRSNGMFMYEGSQQGVNVQEGIHEHGMLAYLIDTFGGQSGSPVFWANSKQTPMPSIGVHVLGVGKEHTCTGPNCQKFNKAVRFGHLGQDPFSFIRALHMEANPENFQESPFIAASPRGPKPNILGITHVSHLNDGTTRMKHERYKENLWSALLSSRGSIVPKQRRTVGSLLQQLPARNDFAAGGKYSGICQILRYGNGLVWACGWLIDESTIATVDFLLDRTVDVDENSSIFAFLGYHGEDENHLQRRKVEYVLRGSITGQRARNESFIPTLLKLQTPFDGAQILEVAHDFKMSNNATYGVVANLSWQENSLLPRSIHSWTTPTSSFPEAASIKMEDDQEDHDTWTYVLDTAPGTAGAPILRRDSNKQMQIVGIHSGTSPREGIFSKRGYKFNQAMRQILLLALQHGLSGMTQAMFGFKFSFYFPFFSLKAAPLQAHFDLYKLALDGNAHPSPSQQYPE